jgi:hypothetical protein
MAPVGFEPAIPGGERQQIYALDSAAIGIGHGLCNYLFLISFTSFSQPWTGSLDNNFFWIVFDTAVNIF